MSNLDKRRTILENLQAQRHDGRAALRRRHATTTCASRPGSRTIRHESNAVVIAMRDVSGSMGEFEKYITRSFYFWMVRFLRTKYDQRRDRLHHPPHRGEGGRRGGVLQPRRERRHEGLVGLPAGAGHHRASATRPSDWNIYPFHFSDGDNWGEVDNQLCLELVQAAAGELQPRSATARSSEGGRRSPSTLMSRLRSRSTTRKFIGVTITRQGRRLPGAAEVLLARATSRHGGAVDERRRTSCAELRDRRSSEIWEIAQALGPRPVPDPLRDRARDDHVRVRRLRPARAGSPTGRTAAPTSRSRRCTTTGSARSTSW